MCDRFNHLRDRSIHTRRYYKRDSSCRRFTQAAPLCLILHNHRQRVAGALATLELLACRRCFLIRGSLATTTAIRSVAAATFHLWHRLTHAGLGHRQNRPLPARCSRYDEDQSDHSHTLVYAIRACMPEKDTVCDGPVTRLLLRYPRIPPPARSIGSATRLNQPTTPYSVILPKISAYQHDTG